MLLELGALEVAAEQVAGAELTDAKVVDRGRSVEGRQSAELLAPYFQFRAPRRQTYTRPSRRSATNTMISARTNTECAPFRITPTG